MEFEIIRKKAVECVEVRLSKNKIKNNIDLTLTHLIEEFGELALQINNGKLKRKEVDVDNIGEEISDCIILLIMLSKQYNINLEKVLLNKIEIIKNKR
jgi:NTP pyrophosphatase (non-canonical NTP hydrolase)